MIRDFEGIENNGLDPVLPENEESEDLFEVLVPAMLKVRLRAPDDLAAEVLAGEIADAIGWIERPPSHASEPASAFRVEAILKPGVSKVSP
jgi:hypothetical protein